MDTTKPYYDPLKYFMILNRTVRRSMGDRPDGLIELYADSNYRTLEILAIYQ